MQAAELGLDLVLLTAELGDVEAGLVGGDLGWGAVLVGGAVTGHDDVVPLPVGNRIDGPVGLRRPGALRIKNILARSNQDGWHPDGLGAADIGVEAIADHGHPGGIEPDVRQGHIKVGPIGFADEFGLDVFMRRTMILPLKDFFPDEYDASDESIRVLLDHVCGYMDADPALVELEFFSNPNDLWLINRRGQYLPHLAGQYDEQQSQKAIIHRTDMNGGRSIDSSNSS